MPRAAANGIEIEYDITGDAGAEPLLLIMGLGAQLIRWPMAFVERLAARGFKVIRFDNRDVGLSTKLEAAGPPDFPAILKALEEGREPHAPYGLEDMVADTVGLLDALGIGRAHIVGASLGGMIAQLMAADWPDRTASLVSIMSRARNQAPAEMARHAMMMTNLGPDPQADLEGYLDHMTRRRTMSGSPGFPTPPEEERDRVRRDFERCYYPLGFQRQFAASLVAPDRRPKLAGVGVPTVVIHGAQDPLMPLVGGEETAAAIPGADLRVIDGMGHNLPAQLYDRVIDGIASAAERAHARAG